MRAWTIDLQTPRGTLSPLTLSEVPTPPSGPHEVRVSVYAVGVNRADIVQRQGVYPAPPGVPANIPGLEFAGVVESTGNSVKRFRAGDRVFGLVGGGAYAEQVVAPEDTLSEVPSNLSLTEAASLVEGSLTAFDAMVSQAGLREQQTVLITAAGSGVGLVAIQVAKAVGATVVGTSRSPAKLQTAKACGLDVSVVPDGGSFSRKVLEATNQVGVDLVLDLVGGAYVGECIRCLRTRGTLVVVGLVGGTKTELNLGELLAKRATMIGTVLRSRSLAEKTELTRTFDRRVIPWIVSGQVRPHIDKVFTFEQANEAHDYMVANANTGKLVLAIRDEK